MLTKPQQLFSLSLLGWPLVLIGSTLLGLYWTQYSLLSHTLSVLASVASPTRIAMNIIFTIAGTLTMIYGYRLNQVLNDNDSLITTGNILMVAGVLLILLSFFPGGIRMGADVETQGTHNTIASTLIFLFVLAPLVFIQRMWKHEEWHTSLVIILIITILKSLSYAGSVLVVLTNNFAYLAGLFQRFGLFLDCLWSIYSSYKLVRFYN